MYTIGEIFKEIRSKKKLSLEYVCHGICSKATLSRFENNIGDIQLNKFLKLLKKMEISETEFFSYIDANRKIFSSHFLDKIATLYRRNDTHSLYDIAKKYKQNYSINDSKIDFLYYMITANYYNDLTNNKICTSTEIERLYNILFRNEEWDALQIETFGNTTSLLNSDFIYSLSNELLDQLHRIARTNYPLYYNSCFTLLNAFQILILRHSSLARRLDNRLQNYEFLEINATFNITLYFFHCLLYSEKKQELESIINFLEETHCKVLSTKLNNILKSYIEC